MKNSSTLLVLVATLVLFTNCKNTAAEPPVQPTSKKEISAASLETATLSIEGMTCAIGCAKTIQTKLSKLEGVQEAVVDFDLKTAVVKFDGTIQTQESLKNTVEAVAGGDVYRVTSIDLAKK